MYLADLEVWRETDGASLSPIGRPGESEGGLSARLSCRPASSRIGWRECVNELRCKNDGGAMGDHQS